MTRGSEIFKKHYHDYCQQISKVDFAQVKDRLGISLEGQQAKVCFVNETYTISDEKVTDASGKRPSYMICVILFKYILLCPDQHHHDARWVSFKDFKRTTHFTNVNYFASDTEQVIEKSFTGRLDALARACEKLGGYPVEEDMPYDLAMQLDILPRISSLLLFNDQDEDFPAKCTVLFEKHAEFYLDPESMAMASASLVKRVVEEG